MSNVSPTDKNVTHICKKLSFLTLNIHRFPWEDIFLEAVSRGCSVKFQADACSFILKKRLTQVFSFEFCEIFKNTFIYRTPPVAAFEFLVFSFESCEISKNAFFTKHLRVTAFIDWIVPCFEIRKECNFISNFLLCVCTVEICCIIKRIFDGVSFFLIC